MRRQRDMSVTDKHFSEIFQNSFEILAVVQGLAARGGFASLNELCDKDPDIVARYCNTAIIAIAALKKLQRKQQGGNSQN